MKSELQNKILIIHLVTGLESHGAERAMAKIVTSSDPAKFQHQVVSMGGMGPIGEELKSKGVNVHVLNLPAKSSFLIAPIRFARILRTYSPQVLHCWMYHANLFGTILGKIMGVPRIVWSVRTSNTHLAYYSSLTRYVVRMCVPVSHWADVITVNSEAGEKLHQSWGYASGKMKLIPNGFDLELFKPDSYARRSVRSEFGIGDDLFLVGLFARFHPIKDHPTFLRAAGRLKRRFPHVRFLLCGDGVTPANVTLSRMLYENNLGEADVYRLGPRNDIARLMTALDLYCLSSTSEAFPNVVGEAMACAVPCVVTNVGDSANIVGDTGYVVPPGDAHALEEACSRVIEMETIVRTKLGTNARKRVVNKFDLGKMLQGYDSIYENAKSKIESQTTYSLAT